MVEKAKEKARARAEERKEKLISSFVVISISLSVLVASVAMVSSDIPDLPSIDDIIVTADPTGIPADGLSRSTITATVMGTNITGTNITVYFSITSHPDGVELTNTSYIIYSYSETNRNAYTELIAGMEPGDVTIEAQCIDKTNTTTVELIPTPLIIDRYNNKTKNNAISVTINESECVYFNATADQPIDAWRWYKDDILAQEGLSNEFETSWVETGTHYVKVNATNANGTSNTIVWDINVAYVPVVARIEVSPSEVTLNVSETVPFTATAYDQYDIEMPDVIFTWAVSNSTVGEVNETTGLFHAIYPGTTLVNAIADSVTGSATVTVAAQPDLIVTAIIPNCDSLFANESNTVNATIKNNGTEEAGAFNVSFDIAGSVQEARVSGLVAGEDIEVCVTDPAERDAGESVMITVTADCNTEIDESDETNNDNSTEETVVNNGYKNKSFMGMDSLELFEYDAEMYGSVVYNVSGTKNYPFEPAETDTRIHHIDIPAGMSIKKARLYVYWYDYWGNPSPGYLANLSVNFIGTTFKTPDKMYTDQKGFGTYNTPKGTYAYDVATLVTGSGDYNVVVENIDPTHSTTLLGEMLLVVYEDPTETKKIQLWIIEGNDLLKGDINFCVTPEEATATVAFPGTIADMANKSATLISVVAQGNEPGSNMIFNGAVIKPDAWNSPTEAYPGSKINVEMVDVTANLGTSGNNMGFQDTGTMGMQASNAILVVEEKVGYNVSVPLLEDWNMIGTPLNVTNWTLPTVLDSIDGHYDVINYFNATTDEMEYYYAAFPGFSDFQELEPGAGYLIHMTASDTLQWEAPKFEALLRYLEIDWNMFSVPYGIENETLPTVLDSIDGHYDVINYFNATTDEMEYYYAAFPGFSDFRELEPGAGYLIHMTASDTFVAQM